MLQLPAPPVPAFGGHDAFVFNNGMGAGNVATIENFSVARDHIELSTNVFTNVGDFGLLPTAEFHIGAKATAAGQRIIYDARSGEGRAARERGDPGAAEASSVACRQLETERRFGQAGVNAAADR